MTEVKKSEKTNQDEYKSLSIAKRNQIRSMLLDGTDVEDIAKEVGEPFYPVAAYTESAKCDDIRVIINKDGIKKDYFAGFTTREILSKYNVTNSAILQAYLTQIREQAVFDDVLAGCTTAEIAKNYGISESLVSKYAHNTLSKMLRR